MNTQTLTQAERSAVLDCVSACQSAYHIESTPGHRFGGLPGELTDNRRDLIETVEAILADRLTIEPSPAPVQPETSNSAEFDGIETLAHRIAWRYKKSSDPAHSDTWTFNSATLAQFARAVSESVRPQAEPVAEIIECSKMGQQTVKEIEGRWRFLDYGTKLYAVAAPVAQADTAMLDWLEQHDGEFHNIDRISSIVGTGFLTGPLNTSTKHQTLRAAIDAAMKGTP